MHESSASNSSHSRSRFESSRIVEARLSSDLDTGLARALESGDGLSRRQVNNVKVQVGGDGGERQDL
ncbi:hypothetical protein HYQ46_008206, partial [Verticillium longisporum]